MSSGDLLVFLFFVVFFYLFFVVFLPRLTAIFFLLFFHQIFNCLLYLLVRCFFLLFFSSALVQYFFIARVIVLIIHYLFSYICQLSAIKITIYHALRR